jgi:hypothetical protein
MVIVGVISLIMVALTFGGPRVFDKVLPESALVWIETMGTMDGDMVFINGGGGKSKSDWGGETAESHILDSLYGYAPSDEIAAAPGRGAVFIAEVLDGHSRRMRGVSPGHVDPLTPVDGCTVTPPARGTVLGHVNAMAPSGREIELVTYGDAELAQGVRDLARHYRKTGTTAFANLKMPAFDTYDVVVTETAAPVYLVLQTEDAARIWNIHLAPGVKIERVVLLGGPYAGVANLPAAVPVEVMAQAQMDACGLPEPAFPLNPRNVFNQKAEAGKLDADEVAKTRAELEAAITAYDGWFRQQFGQGALETVAGAWTKGDIAAIGPVPASAEGRAVWTSVKGATLRSTMNSYVDHAGLAEQGVDYAARVKAIATAFAWGNLQTMRPKEQF